MNLDKSLDHLSAPDLHQQLLHRLNNGEPIKLNAANVETLSPISIQVLIAAKALANEKQLEFQITDRSECFSQILSDLGCTDLL